jgi:hypothetical protein
LQTVEFTILIPTEFGAHICPIRRLGDRCPATIEPFGTHTAHERTKGG